MKKKIKIVFFLFIMFMFIRYNFPFQKYFPVEMNNAYFISQITKEHKIVNEIHIFDKVTVDDYLIVAYFKGEMQTADAFGYAKFKLNKYDHYEIQYNTSRSLLERGKDIYVNDDSFKLEEGLEHYCLVLSNNPNLSEIRFLIKNNNSLIINKVDHNPSITLIKLPMFENFHGEYNFFDKDGNEIR